MLQIVWDPVKKSWVDTSKDGEEETAPLAPPPSMSSMAPLPAGLPPSDGGSRFSLKGRGGRTGRNNYINLNSMPSISSSAATSPLTLLNQMPTSSSLPQLFVPSSFPVPDSAPASSFVSSPSHEPQQPMTESNEPFLYNTSQLTNPVAQPPGRLAGRRQYPR